MSATSDHEIGAQELSSSLSTTSDIKNKRYCWGKCSRRTMMWSACCTTLAIVIVIIVLIALYVVAPSVAQGSLDKAIITIDAMDIHGDGVTMYNGKDTQYVEMTLNFTAYNTNFLSAIVKPSVATLKYDGKAFAEQNMPELNLEAAEAKHFSIPVTMYITDFDQFNKFGGALMQMKNLTVTMEAKVDVTSSSLNFNGLKLDKDITMYGFNGFIDPAPILKELKFLQTSELDRVPYDPKIHNSSIWSRAVTLMPNPSTATVKSVGNITGDVYSAETGGIWLGNMWSENTVTIERGSNNVLVTQIMLQKNSENEDLLRTVLEKYSAGVDQTVYLRGTGSSNPIWNGTVKHLGAAVKMGGLKNRQDKMFVALSSMVDGSLNMLTDLDYWYDQIPYCSQGVKDYDKDNKAHCGPAGAVGRYFRTELTSRNSMGMDLLLSDWEYEIDIMLPREDGSIDYEPFAWLSSNHTGQETTNMPAMQSTVVPLGSCSVGLLMDCPKDDTGKSIEGQFPAFGDALKQLHAGPFKNYKRDFMGIEPLTANNLYDWTDYTSMVSSPLMIAMVTNNATHVANFQVRIRGISSMTHHQTGFRIDRVKLVQEWVPVMFRFYNVMPPQIPEAASEGIAEALGDVGAAITEGKFSRLTDIFRALVRVMRAKGLDVKGALKVMLPDVEKLFGNALPAKWHLLLDVIKWILG